VNIVICIKQVPDTAEVRINPETNTLIREGVPSIINPYDTHAIEAGLQIREAACGKAVVLTMGPPQAEAALREAISMGVDEAVLLTDLGHLIHPCEGGRKARCRHHSLRQAGHRRRHGAGWPGDG